MRHSAAPRACFGRTALAGFGRASFCRRCSLCSRQSTTPAPSQGRNALDNHCGALDALRRGRVLCCLFAGPRAQSPFVKSWQTRRERGGEDGTVTPAGGSSKSGEGRPCLMDRAEAERSSGGHQCAGPRQGCARLPQGSRGSRFVQRPTPPCLLLLPKLLCSSSSSPPPSSSFLFLRTLTAAVHTPRTAMGAAQQHHKRNANKNIESHTTYDVRRCG